MLLLLVLVLPSLAAAQQFPASPPPASLDAGLLDSGTPTSDPSETGGSGGTYEPSFCEGKPAGIYLDTTNTSCFFTCHGIPTVEKSTHMGYRNCCGLGKVFLSVSSRYPAGACSNAVQLAMSPPPLRRPPPPLRPPPPVRFILLPAPPSSLSPAPFKSLRACCFSPHPLSLQHTSTDSHLLSHRRPPCLLARSVFSRLKIVSESRLAICRWLTEDQLFHFRRKSLGTNIAIE